MTFIYLNYFYCNAQTFIYGFSSGVFSTKENTNWDLNPVFFIELLSKDKQNSEMQLFQVSSLPV